MEKYPPRWQQNYRPRPSTSYSAGGLQSTPCRSARARCRLDAVRCGTFRRPGTACGRPRCGPEPMSTHGICASPAPPHIHRCRWRQRGTRYAASIRRRWRRVINSCRRRDTGSTASCSSGAATASGAAVPARLVSWRCTCPSASCWRAYHCDDERCCSRAASASRRGAVRAHRHRARACI